MIMWLERIGSVELVVRWLYINLLISSPTGVFDVAKRKKKERVRPPRARNSIAGDRS